MKLPTPVVDYRKLRPRNLNTPEFFHLKWLIFWPVFFIFFMIVERIYIVNSYYPMHCALDDYIPFCEWFLIPYLLWFVFIIGTLLYGLLYEVDLFRREMKFIAITYCFALAVYFLFPNCQELRPLAFARDNLLTRFMALFYQFDTNTNVFPSIHVMGALASMCAVLHSKGLRHPAWKAAAAVLAVLICLSTVFLKQHSILDVFGALPVCLVAWYICFLRKEVKNKECLTDSSAA